MPVIVKLLAVNDKSGVMICESLQSLEAALKAILGLGQNIVVQQYLQGAKGRDLRVLVVGGRSWPRCAGPAHGAVREGPPPRRSLRAGRAASGLRARGAGRGRVLQARVCAVDMLDVKGVPRVFEVNSSPSIKEAETACGVDAADRIVKRAIALAEAAAAPGAETPPRTPCPAAGPRERGLNAWPLRPSLV